MAATESFLSGDRSFMAATESFLPSDRNFMATAESFLWSDRSFMTATESFLPSDRSFMAATESFLPSDRRKITATENILPSDRKKMGDEGKNKNPLSNFSEKDFLWKMGLIKKLSCVCVFTIARVSAVPKYDCGVWRVVFIRQT